MRTLYGDIYDELEREKEEKGGLRQRQMSIPLFSLFHIML